MRAARKDKTHKPSDLCTLEQAAVITREALADLLRAEENEPLRLALARSICDLADIRIVTHEAVRRERRWYRRLWRRVRG